MITFFRKIFLPKNQFVIDISNIPEAGFWKRNDLAGSVNIYVHEADEQFWIKMEIYFMSSIVYRVHIDPESSAEVARAKILQMQDDILWAKPQMKIILIWNNGKLPPS